MVEPPSTSQSDESLLLERMITTARITIFLFVQSHATLEAYYDHRVTILGSETPACIRFAMPVSYELFLSK